MILQVVVGAVENEDLTEAVRLEFLKQVIEVIPAPDRKALVAAVNRRLPSEEKGTFFAQVCWVQVSLVVGYYSFGCECRS